MASRSKSTHHRFLLLVAALFLTSPLALVALVPDASTNAAPVKPLPATGGPTESSGPTKDKVASKSGDEPLKPVKVKPIAFNAERDADVARVVGTLLEQRHYLQTPISPEMSQRWLKNYLDSLDVFHLFFLQSDVDEFTAKYGNNLGDLLHGNNEQAIIAPAFEIYNRYLQRVDENVKLAEKLLHEKYDFTKDELYTTRDHKSPWIQDAAASQSVWRGQVKYDLLNGRLDKKTPEATIKRLSKRYQSLLREGAEKEDMDVLEVYLNALTEAFDPHSSYFEPVDAQNFNILALDHSVTGIGAVLRSEDGYATIEEVIPGGPADLDKRLQPGDRILAVGQGTAEPVDAVDMNLNHVVEMIRGHKGSMVRLVVAPAGAAAGSAHKIYDIKRDAVSIKDSLAKARILEHKLPDGGTEKVGVIALHDFYEKTAYDVAKLVQRLKKEKVDGIILDLRGNGGGLLVQAADLTGLFAKAGPVVQIRSSDGTIEQLAPDSRMIYDGPLMVMVNKMSASATEIVAAALQDYGRALIVGDQSTHGKGTVQQLYPLEQYMPIGFPSDPGAGSLKMTNKKFYRVAGGSTQEKGVTPDIVLPSLLDAFSSSLGETTLPYYLPWDTVQPAKYEILDLTAPYLPDLKTNSAARVAASQDFNYLRQDIAYDKKQMQNKTVSLNEAVRLKEQEDLKTLKATRKKDLEARAGSRDKVLELTLDMVDNDQPAAPPVDKKPKVSLSEDADPNADAEAAAAAKEPKDDPQLDEAVNIMSDYTKMLRDSGSRLVQATPPANK